MSSPGRGYDMLKTASSGSAPLDVPFLNVVDPAFDLVSPEVMLAQARSWYAESPIGLLAMRYAEARDLLGDRRMDHNGQGYNGEERYLRGVAL
jgi:hypothetical protein